MAAASGVSRGGRISIRPGLDPAEEFSVLAHELAHELLHRGEDRPASKTVRETEAEAVAFVVCQAVGIDSRTAASDYIKHYDGNTRTLSMSLERIQSVGAAILLALNYYSTFHCPVYHFPLCRHRGGSDLAARGFLSILRQGDIVACG